PLSLLLNEVLQALCYQIDVTFRRLYALLEFFLERMQHVNRVSVSHRIDSTIGTAFVAFPDFDNVSTTKPFERLRHRRVALANLRQEQGVAHLSLGGSRKRHEIGLRGATPYEWFGLLTPRARGGLCEFSHNSSIG